MTVESAAARRPANLGQITQKETITQPMWDMLKVTDPEVFARYYTVPLSFFIRSYGEEEAQAYRSRASLIDVVEQWFNFVGHPHKKEDRAASLGLSLLNMKMLAETTIHCIAEDTKKDLPRSKLSRTDMRVKQIREAVARYHTLLALKDGARDLGRIEEAVISYALEGMKAPQIAQVITFDMQLDIPLHERRVGEILGDLFHNQDHRHNARIPERKIKAHEMVEAEKQGRLHNAHAALAERILQKLNKGSSKEDVCTELGINRDQYRAVMDIVVKDLLADTQGAKNIETILEKLGFTKYPTVPRQINRVFRELLEPYREYRIDNLGETLKGESLTATKFSLLERSLVEAAMQGRYDNKTAKDLKLRTETVTECMNILFDEKKLLTRSQDEHDYERKQVWQCYWNNNQQLPENIASLKGYPASLFLGFLQQGYSYEEICREIEVSGGSRISVVQLSRWFSRIRAHYKKTGQLDEGA